MAFTLTLICLVGLSLTEFKPTSASFFGGGPANGPFLPNPNPVPFQRQPLPAPPAVSASDQARIDDYLRNNAAARQALENVKARASLFQNTPVPCECLPQSICSPMPTPVMPVVPPGASNCVRIFPVVLENVECANPANTACQEIVSCGPTPAATCAPGGSMTVQTFSVCFTFTLPFLSFLTPMETVATNCCCTKT